MTCRIAPSIVDHIYDSIPTVVATVHSDEDHYFEILNKHSDNRDNSYASSDAMSYA